MVAQRLEDFLNSDFLENSSKALYNEGFVTDEHDFAPYRETMNAHFIEIQNALEEIGHSFEIFTGYVKHGKAGYAYFIYDSGRFDDLKEAKKAVSLWLDNKYNSKNVSFL